MWVRTSGRSLERPAMMFFDDVSSNGVNTLKRKMIIFVR